MDSELTQLFTAEYQLLKPEPSAKVTAIRKNCQQRKYCYRLCTLSSTLNMHSNFNFLLIW